MRQIQNWDIDLPNGPNGIDIVIVNFNSTDLLIECLRTLFDQMPSDISCHIRVEDNGSGDHVSRVAEAFPEVRVIRNGKNLGFAKAVNSGMTAGTGKYIVLLNPDSRVTPGFFEQSLAFMESHPNVGVIGPKILNQGGTVQHSARSFPTPMTALFGRTALLSRLFPRNSLTMKNLVSKGNDGRTPASVDWVSGACMVVRRSAAESVGWLDERFWMYWEDADWCRRMRADGWDVYYCPSAVICHHVAGSSRTRPVRSMFHFHKSAFYFFQKYHGGIGWALVYPLVLSALGVRFLIHAARHRLVTLFRSNA